MPQMLNDVDAAAAAPVAKQAWSTPVIESYDVAEFTLAVAGSRFNDAGANIS